MDPAACDPISVGFPIRTPDTGWKKIKWLCTYTNSPLFLNQVDELWGRAGKKEIGK